MQGNGGNTRGWRSSMQRLTISTSASRPANRPKLKQMKGAKTKRNLGRFLDGDSQFAHLIRPIVYGARKNAQYTVEEFESKIYSNIHHSRAAAPGQLLEEDKIILQQEDLPTSSRPENNTNHTNNNQVVATDSVTGSSNGAGSRQPDTRLIRFVTDRLAKAWAVALLITTLFSLVVSPLTFILGGTWTEPDLVPGGQPLLAFDVILDIMYGALLGVKFNMSFMHPYQRVEVTDRVQIRNRMLFSLRYVLQWLTVIPYVLIIGFGVTCGLNSIKIVRMMNFILLPDALWKFHDEALVRIVKPVIMLVTFAHWVACVLFTGGGYRESLEANGESAYVTTLNGQSISGQLSLYVMSFVEAIYMLTGALDNPLGDGSQRDKNFGSLIIVSFFGPVGCVVVSWFIAVIVRESRLRYALENRHQENQAFVMRALENLDIPPQLRKRVVSLHYYQRMSHDYEAFGELFKRNNLSRPLEDAIRVYLYQSVLKSVFFKGTDTSYVLEVLRIMEDRMFLPGDYVARRGEVGAEMFFISQGEVAIKIPGNIPDDVNYAINIGKKVAGDYFGEVSLVQRSTRTAWILAQTYVVCSVLPRSSLEIIWEYFPSQRENLVAAVQEMSKKDKARKRKQVWSRAKDKLTRAGVDQRVSFAAPGDDESGNVAKEADVVAMAKLIGKRRSVVDVADSDSPAQPALAALTNITRRKSATQGNGSSGAAAVVAEAALADPPDAGPKLSSDGTIGDMDEIVVSMDTASPPHLSSLFDSDGGIDDSATGAKETHSSDGVAAGEDARGEGDGGSDGSDGGDAKQPRLVSVHSASAVTIATSALLSAAERAAASGDVGSPGKDGLRGFSVPRTNTFAAHFDAAVPESWSPPTRSLSPSQSPKVSPHTSDGESVTVRATEGLQRLERLGKDLLNRIDALVAEEEFLSHHQDELRTAAQGANAKVYELLEFDRSSRASQCSLGSAQRLSVPSTTAPATFSALAVAATVPRRRKKTLLGVTPNLSIETE